jgi:hypothetical protein
MSNSTTEKLKQRIERWERVNQNGMTRFVCWNGLSVTYFLWLLVYYFFGTFNFAVMTLMIVMYPVGLLAGLGMWQLFLWAYAKDKKRLSDSNQYPI